MRTQEQIQSELDGAKAATAAAQSKVKVLEEELILLKKESENEKLFNSIIRRLPGCLDSRELLFRSHDWAYAFLPVHTLRGVFGNGAKITVTIEGMLP